MSTTRNKLHPLLLPLILSQAVTLETCLDIGGVKLLSLVNYCVMTISVLSLISFVILNRRPSGFAEKALVGWIIILLVLAVPDILDPFFDHRNLKLFLTIFSFLYTIPLFMMAEPDIQFLRQLFKFLYALALIYLPCLLLSGGGHENMTALAEGSLILLMTFPYHSDRKRVVIVTVILLTLLLMMLEARRNKVVYYGGALMLALFINMISGSKVSAERKKSFIFLTLFFIVILLLNGTYFAKFFDRMGTGFDSRNEIVRLFIKDFSHTPADWVFGRGLYGQFFGGTLSTSSESGLRDGIENGYLQLVLKGGGIWLTLMAAISIRSIYLGYFKSDNLLCRGAAMIVFLYWLDMVGFGVPQTSMKYIMIFISIAICNTSWLRECDDAFLSQELGLKS